MSIRDTILDAFYSLGRNINKRGGDQSAEVAEGVVGARIPELSLDLNNDDLIKLSDVWERSWNDSETKNRFEARGKDNEKYWKGEHFETLKGDKNRAMVDNAIFEGLEGYLPQVTRRNPEGMVQLAVGVEQSEENQKFAHALQLELGEIAKEISLRIKLKGVARNHEIYLLGAVKLGWNLDKDIPAIVVVRPQKLILDPDAPTDEDGYSGERIGEHRKLAASKLISFMEGEPGADENIKFIKELVKDNLGTEVGFIEWWTRDYFFWKLGKRVLAKRKNPHWNYDEEQPVDTTVTGESQDGVQAEEPIQEPEAEPTVPNLPQGAPALPQLPDQGGMLPPEPRKGINHLKVREMPYILLAYYSLGKSPVNETSNIGQNLSNQDLINKRIKQIDKNADSMNGGMVVSLERSGLTKDQAARVTESIRKGGTVAIATGTPDEAIKRMSANGLPADVYNQLVDVRSRVRDIWGTRGLSPAGQGNETTVRGKIITKGLDTDRIGGGISEYLEQFSSKIYNWLTQLLYVYDDRFSAALQNGVQPPRVTISVKEGSLLPKDSTTIANQAIELAASSKMSLLDLYKRLDYPNPEELAVNAWLELNAPDLLYPNDPRVKEALARAAQAAQAKGAKGPSESISFKDLPPEGKAQMAKQAGIDLHPEAIAVHDIHKEARSKPPVLPDTETAPQI